MIKTSNINPISVYSGEVITMNFMTRFNPDGSIREMKFVDDNFMSTYIGECARLDPQGTEIFHSTDFTEVVHRDNGSTVFDPAPNFQSLDCDNAFLKMREAEK